MNEGINLLDPNKKNAVLAPTKRIQGMRFFAIAMLFVVSASAVILFILVALSPLPALRQQEQTLRQNLAAGHPDMLKLALLNERSSAIGTLLTDRGTYDQTLDLLQSSLPSNVAISTIRIDNGQVALTINSKSLQALDTYLNYLMQLVQDKKGFTQLTLTSLINDDSQSTYSVTVNLVML